MAAAPKAPAEPKGKKDGARLAGSKCEKPSGQHERDDSDADHERYRVDGARARHGERGGGAQDDDGDRVQQIEADGECGHVDAERGTCSCKGLLG
jgi:hypothetical protein